MGILDIAGGIGSGISAANSDALRNSSVERENAIKDYQIKEAAQREQSLNKHIPLESFFPNSKQYPEGNKFLMNSLKENGFKVSDAEGIPSMKVRDLIEFKKIFEMKEEMNKGFMGSLKSDLVRKHDSITQKVDTGLDEEGKAIKPDDMEKLKAEQAAILKRHNSIVNFEEAGRLAVEKQKAMAAAANKDMKPYGQGPKGEKLFIKGNQVVDADGNPVSKDVLQSATPQSEINVQAPRISTVVHAGGEPKDNRSTEEKAYERAKKDGWKSKGGGNTFMDFLKEYKQLSQNPNTGRMLNRPTTD